MSDCSEYLKSRIGLAAKSLIEYPLMMFRKETLFILALVACWVRPIHAQNPPVKVQPAANQYRYWTTKWSFQDIAVGDLVNKLRLIGVDIPIRMDGKATVQFTVSVPLNALRTGKAYRFNGTLAIRELVADQASFDLFEAEVSFSDGKLVLEPLRLVEHLDSDGAPDLSAGLVVGSATAELIPRGQFTADVHTTALGIGPIADLISRLGLSPSVEEVAGSVTATVSASGRVDDFNAPEQWTIQGDLIASGLRRGESIKLNLSASKFRWGTSALSVERLHLDSPDRPEFFVTADANVQFGPTTQFSMNLSVNDAPLQDLLGLSLEDSESVVEGKLDARGSVTGSLGRDRNIESMDLQLAVASPSVSVSGLRLGLLEHDLRLTANHLSLTPRQVDQADLPEDLVIRSLEADYETSSEFARFSNLNAYLFAGTLRGQGQFARSDQLEHRAQLKWDNVRPEIKLPLASAGRQSRLTAETSGDLVWSAPAARLLTPSEHQAQASVAVSEIEINGEPVGQATASISMADQSLDVAVDGQLFGGTIRVETSAVLDQASRWDELPSRLRLSRLDLGKLSLGRLLRFAGSNAAAVGGVVSLTCEPNSINFAEVSGNAIAEVSSLTVNGMLISPSLKAELGLADQIVVVKSAGGSYAGGQLEINGKWALTNGVQLLTARLTRADGGRMLLPVHKNARSWVGGTVSGRATITGRGDGLFDSIRITGAVDVEKGSTFGMPVGDAHGPLEVIVAADPLRWRVSFPAVRSKLARGRVTGDLVFSSASAGTTGIHMDSHWRINHVDFESLLSSSIGTSTIGRGDVTGVFRLQGRNIQGVKDLEGRFQVRLGGTDATAVPGLSAAGSLLGATSLVGVRFEQGEAIGRVRKGNLLIENAIMTSDRVSVQASGSVGLIDRRMNIDAVIATGNFQGQNVVFQQFGSQALLSFVPMGRLNQVLSERTIVIEMVGPTRDPVIRLMTGETLRANTRRFAIQEAMGFVIADSLLFD